MAWDGPGRDVFLSKIYELSPTESRELRLAFPKLNPVKFCPWRWIGPAEWGVCATRERHCLGCALGIISWNNWARAESAWGAGQRAVEQIVNNFKKFRFTCEISKEIMHMAFSRVDMKPSFLVKGRNSVLPKERWWLVPFGCVPGETVWGRISRFLSASAYVIANFSPRGLG